MFNSLAVKYLSLLNNDKTMLLQKATIRFSMVNHLLV